MAKVRRGQNQGSVYQRKDGVWAAAVTLPGTGKRKVYYANNRLEVEQKLAKVLSGLGQGIEPPVRQTVRSHLNYWLDHVVKPHLRPKTYAFYEQQVRIHLLPSIGNIQITKLTPMQVQAVLNAKLAEGLSPHSVDAIRRTLRAALNQAVRWNMVDRNVATLVRTPKKPQRAVNPLDQKGLRKLLVAIKGDPLEALLVVAVGTGLRQGELLGLHWDDLDLDRGTLTVRGQLQAVEGILIIMPVKTARSNRTIALPDFIINSLRDHKVSQDKQRVEAGIHWHDKGLVFTARKGTPLYARNVYRQFHRLLKQADLPPMRFHDLRHTAATLMLAQGVDVRTIMEVLGHSQISLTLNTYSHVVPSLKHNAANQMDDLLNEAVEG